MTIFPAASDKGPQAPAPEIIVLRGLNLFYGDFQALQDIDVTFPRQAITALIGPSGCGKSTLLRTLNRMNDLIEGVRITGEVLIDGPRLHGQPRKAELDEILERSLTAVEMWGEVKDRLKTPALSLTEEQQQRLCIARVLAVEPEILLMDEPCSALDPLATLRIEELMQELKSNYTIIIVTHNMQQAARASDLSGFMYLGELIEIGPTGDIFTRPKDSRTEDYITGKYG
jgi:phosphate transport system ATP-binding protein